MNKAAGSPDLEYVARGITVRFSSRIAATTVDRVVDGAAILGFQASEVYAVYLNQRGNRLAALIRNGAWWRERAFAGDASAGRTSLVGTARYGLGRV